MLPGVKDSIKRLAMIICISIVPLIAVGAIFFQDADKGYLTSSFSGEVFAILMVSALLFTITIPLVQTKTKNINNDSDVGNFSNQCHSTGLNIQP
jgi:hypothetical protein